MQIEGNRLNTSNKSQSKIPKLRANSTSKYQNITLPQRSKSGRETSSEGVFVSLSFYKNIVQTEEFAMLAERSQNARRTQTLRYNRDISWKSRLAESVESEETDSGGRE